AREREVLGLQRRAVMARDQELAVRLDVEGLTLGEARAERGDGHAARAERRVEGPGGRVAEHEELLRRGEEGPRGDDVAGGVQADGARPGEIGAEVGRDQPTRTE